MQIIDQQYQSKIIIVVMINKIKPEQVKSFKAIQKIGNYNANYWHSPFKKENTQNSNTNFNNKSPLRKQFSNQGSTTSPNKISTHLQFRNKFDASNKQKIEKRKENIQNSDAPCRQSTSKDQNQIMLMRKTSTKSNKSQGSTRKELYSQFSQLAQAKNIQNNKSSIPQGLCFGNIERKQSIGYVIPRKSTLALNKFSTVSSSQQKTIKPISPKPDVSILKNKDLQQQQDTKIIYDSSLLLQSSLQTIVESVRVSIDFSNDLDMSPYL